MKGEPVAYTLLDCRQVTQPLVAIYPDADDQTGVAQPIYAMAVMRDMNEKGSENLLVPMTGDDFSSAQEHYHSTRADVIRRLPRWIVDNAELYEAASDADGEVPVKRDNDGFWTVDEDVE